MSKERTDSKDATEEVTAPDPDSEASHGHEVGLDVSEQPASTESAQRPKGHSGFRRFVGWCGAHKKTTILGAALLLLGALAAIPVSRYAVAGVFIKQTFTVLVLDQETNKPLPSVAVSVDGQRRVTDSTGIIKIAVRPGKTTIDVTKNYYKAVTQLATVPILRQKSPQTIHLLATGRQVPIAVINSITRLPVENVVVKSKDTETKTNKEGHAILVVPADKKTVAATLVVDGYNQAAVTVQVNTQLVESNTFKLTSKGRIYFLSNLSGKLDVVKANIDGSDRQTVLPGTGKEDKRNTVLLASRDWKYLALLSKRDGGENDKLFLIDTSNDQVTVMDEGNAFFSVAGWNNDTFVYTVYRKNVSNWQSGGVAIKSYKAPTKKLLTLDQTAAAGTDGKDYITEQFSPLYILTSNEIIYAKNLQFSIYSSERLDGKQVTLNSIRADGSAKKVIKGFWPVFKLGYSSLDLRPYGPNGVYVAVNHFDPIQYFEYEDGQIKETTEVNANTFYESYPTYLQSPSGKQSFWSEPRDGKNVLFLGDAKGQNEKQIAALSEYQVYGWYSDEYLLLSKNASELYIMPASGSQQPIKLTDYYKPAITFNGYGGGYGGL